MKDICKICVHGKNGVQEIECRKGQTILSALMEHQIYTVAPCGGRGTCGKCKIKVGNGFLEASEADEKFLTRAERESGIFLACQSSPEDDLTIFLMEQEEADFFVLNGEKEEDVSQIKCGSKGIIIDIGTTTIAMELVDKRSGKILDVYSAINRQRMFGSDVISRIKSANEGKAEPLREIILGDLEAGIFSLLNLENTHDLENIVIIGNTTMIHLLMGYSCKNLGAFPFAPVHLAVTETTLSELFPARKWGQKTPVIILPGISAFVGSDIAAGLLASGFGRSKKINILIDLGTNGEMAIGNKDKIIVTSAAAGPAFEGGNLSFGTGSIAGAICHVSIKNGNISAETIKNEIPAGICGTGAIEAVCELLKEDLIDDTGLLADKYFTNGVPLAKDKEGKNILLTQKDIREIQLAKSAIRAGLEVLLLRYPVCPKEIDTVYLAGGFGYKMDIKKAVRIGLIPELLKNKVKVIGNSALEGGICYIRQDDSRERMQRIIEVSEEISLSNDPEFETLYLEHMYF